MYDYNSSSETRHHMTSCIKLNKYDLSKNTIDLKGKVLTSSLQSILRLCQVIKNYFAHCYVIWMTFSKACVWHAFFKHVAIFSN